MRTAPDLSQSSLSPNLMAIYYHLLPAAAWLAIAIAAFRTDPAILQLFVILSIFALILLNLGERRNGLSAYSVFNKNCEPILGQLRAEQFDSEIRHRPIENEAGTSTQHTQSNQDRHEVLLESTRREILNEQRKARQRTPNLVRPRRRR